MSRPYPRLRSGSAPKSGLADEALEAREDGSIEEKERASEEVRVAILFLKKVKKTFPLGCGTTQKKNRLAPKKFDVGLTEVWEREAGK